MDKWYKCSERLPYEEPEHVLTYDWVLVSSTKQQQVISIARYTDTGWEFFETVDGDVTEATGPWKGELVGVINIEDITHWMPLPKPPKELEHE